jgi:hypothetical protein
MVGMNLFLTKRRAIFLPWGATLKHLQKKIGLPQSKKKRKEGSQVCLFVPFISSPTYCTLALLLKELIR